MNFFRALRFHTQRWLYVRSWLLLRWWDDDPPVFCLTAWQTMESMVTGRPLVMWKCPTCLGGNFRRPENIVVGNGYAGRLKCGTWGCGFWGKVYLKGFVRIS